MTKIKRLGLLTAGGDCPGLNAVIRAVTKAALRQDPPIEVLGILDGYSGLVTGRTRSLADADVSGLLPRGGTILGTSNRDNPFDYLDAGEKTPRDRSKDALATIQREHLDGIIAVGGDGTMRCALEFCKLGVPVIGIPKTIDNDIDATDQTFGFDTAMMVATEAIDRLHSTAESHHRVLICEVMGRNAGWIALRSGIAGGGDVILIPEIPYHIKQVCAYIKQRVQRGKNFSIVVVAEGAKEVGGNLVAQDTYRGSGKRLRLGGISNVLAKQIENGSGLETRVVILGHLQRGGTPTPYDRWLATRFGVHAVDLVKRGHWDHMVSLRGTEITHVTIQQAVKKMRRVDPKGQEIQAAIAVGSTFGQ
jgi:phosphofructokinase-like protein